MKRCPQCGQRTTELQLTQCPYCRVALVTENGPQTTVLAPEQARAVARQILGSWKLWAAVILLMGAAAWGVVQISQKYMDMRSKEYLSALEEKTTNRLTIASSQISAQISNQIESEFKDARIRTAMEQVAKERVNEALTNAIWPSLEGFQQSVSWANSQLAKSTNDLTKLDKDVKAAQRKLAQMLAQIPQPTPAPAAVTPAPAPAPKATPTPTGGTTKLTFASQTVMPYGQDYILTIYFKPTSSTAIGPVSLIAATLVKTQSKIVTFGLVTPGQSQPMVMGDSGYAAQLNFTVAGGDAPVVAVEVTAPTIVQVTGDALAEDLTLPVAAEKMALPSVAK